MGKEFCQKSKTQKQFWFSRKSLSNVNGEVWERKWRRGVLRRGERPARKGERKRGSEEEK